MMVLWLQSVLISALAKCAVMEGGRFFSVGSLQDYDTNKKISHSAYKAHTRRIPETMVCSILMFMWCSGAE